MIPSLIDGIEYNTTDKVQVSELDLGVYTGRRFI